MYALFFPRQIITSSPASALSKMYACFCLSSFAVKFNVAIILYFASFYKVTKNNSCYKTTYLLFLCSFHYPIATPKGSIIIKGNRV